MAASKKSLEDLHVALAENLAEALNERELKVIELPDGTKQTVKLRNASILNVARQFLKDNNIEGKDSPESALGKLKKGMELPFEGSETSY